MLPCPRFSLIVAAPALPAFLLVTAIAASADPARLGPSNSQCPYGTPVFEQDNRADGRVVRHVSVHKLAGSEASFYESGLAIDADGAPNAYHPRGTPGLDSLAAAGYPRSCNVLVCLGRDAHGRNIYARTTSGPFAGFFVSMTTLMDQRKDPNGRDLHPKQDFRRYVDSTSVPYIAVAQRALNPLRLRRAGPEANRPGEIAYVVNLRNGRGSPAIFADVGTNNTLGEGSIALARALGFSERQQSPRIGGVADAILTIVFPASAAPVPWPREQADVAQSATDLFNGWGGFDRVKSCFPEAIVR